MYMNVYARNFNSDTGSLVQNVTLVYYTKNVVMHFKNKHIDQCQN